jgi:hypothetical protein
LNTLVEYSFATSQLAADATSKSMMTTCMTPADFMALSFKIRKPIAFPTAYRILEIVLIRRFIFIHNSTTKKI